MIHEQYSNLELTTNNILNSRLKPNFKFHLFFDDKNLLLAKTLKFIHIINQLKAFFNKASIQRKKAFWAFLLEFSVIFISFSELVFLL